MPEYRYTIIVEPAKEGGYIAAVVAPPAVPDPNNVGTIRRSPPRSSELLSLNRRPSKGSASSTRSGKLQ